MEEQIYRQPRRSGKKWILIIAAVFVLLLSAVAFVLTANRLSLSVELDGEPEMMLEYGGHFQDPGAHLCVRGSLLWKDGMSPEDVSVGIQGKVDDEKTGKYILTYAADYRGMHAEAQRIVRVVDTVCPEIILAPDTGGTLLPGTPYQEAGYRAIDNYDGDITDRVVRSEEYGKIIYAVTDSSGNPGYAEREVPYYDPIPPEITLEGNADMAITTGTFYQEPGYSALDNVDGDLTGQVQVDGEVDWLTPGTYSVTYTVTDGYENTTTATRTVEVKAVPRPEVVWPEGKVIYLTFDAGGDSSQYFALRVRGESMLNAGILPDDLVVGRQQQTANNGEIVVALLGDEATVKTFKKQNGEIWLLPANPDYQPIDGRECEVLGKVVAVVRQY